MLTNEQIDQLITAEKWLEQIQNSPEFEALDFHPDLNLADARQAIAELLDAQKPSNFNPTEDKPVLRIRRIDRRWKVEMFLHRIAVTSLLSSAFAASIALGAWGLEEMRRWDVDLGFGRVDFEQVNGVARGATILSLGCFLASTVAGVTLDKVLEDENV